MKRGKTDAAKMRIPPPEVLAAGWSFFEYMPFPILEIDDDYKVLRTNAAARHEYQNEPTTCFAFSHGNEVPCDRAGETCPKHLVKLTGKAQSVRHAHRTSHGVETHLVCAYPMSDNRILEFHIPVADSLSRDHLTGLYLRDAFEQIVQQQLTLLSRIEQGYGVLMVDLDHFKHINDTYGHLFGDEVLAAVGDVLLRENRQSDAVCRWGGEEFCLFFPAATLEGATHHAQRLLEAIRLIRLQADGVQVAPTASMGLAIAHEPVPLHETIDAADRALYEAKHTGRDRLCIAD